MYFVKKILTKIFYLSFSVLLVTVNSSSGINDTIRVQRQANDNSISRKSCLLPEHPDHGQWSVLGKPSTYLPKMFINNGAVLEINCDIGYKLDGNKWIFCKEETWSSNIGQCLRTCPPIYSTSNMKVTCRHKNQTTENCTDAVDGTLAKFECASYYEDLGLRNMPVHLCHNGLWNQRTPECVPACGQKSVNATSLITEGTTVNHGDYPWQAALYNVENNILICGGSLISQRVVLTAARCVTDFKGKIHPRDLYMVAVGKYYRSYNDSRDVNKAQFSSLQEIFIPRQYKGSSQYFVGDIAILVTTKTFTISQRVQPVCVDWKSNYTSELSNLSSNSYGYVTGWGFTSENENPSEELKELKVPLVTYEQCNQNLPEDYEAFLTDDKFCGGYLDQGIGICRGDTGSGLVLKHKGRYYITGIVSLGSQSPTGGCDSQQYGFYTSVNRYAEEFILEKVSRFKPEDTKMDRQNFCILPEYPNFGTWSVFGNPSNYSAGTPIHTGTLLQIHCNEGYKFFGEKLLICEQGTWSSQIGKCLKICPDIHSDSTMKVTCIHNNKITENCTDAVDGTLAKFECAPYYEDLGLRHTPVHLCYDGSWNQRRPQCVPVCGQKSVSVTSLIIGGTPVKYGDYPWQVALYKVENKILICGGSLISEKFILTAAHCVTDVMGKIRPKELFMVAVGKYYESYNDPRDLITAQFSLLQEILIPRQYKGPNQNYFADIAILVTEKPFTISLRVQPVCVDWGSNYASELSNLSSSSNGYVTGWRFIFENEHPSEELRALKVSPVTYEQCNLPENYEIFLTDDKFCARYLDQGVGICKSDTGNGLVLKHKDRHYITGIASLGPQSPTGRCNRKQFGLYTSVNKYMKEFISRFRPDDTKIDQRNKNSDSCILPKHPENGQWSIINSTLLQEPGESVTSGTVIDITCDESYTLDGPTFIQCKTGKWDDMIGICLKMCPTLISTRSITVTCINNNNNNCTNPTHGTIATLKCAPFYENLDLDRNPFITCRNGRWSSQIPTCVPVCGIKPQSLNIQKKPYYPWNVAIYEQEGETKNFKCAGTLINERIILTSAQCVCNTYGEKFPAINFKVAAGKSLENFQDSRDSEAQYSELEDIFVPREYRGYTRRYRADIAMLITKTPFNITERIQSACLDWNNKFFNEFNYLEVKGYIAGPLASELPLREVIQIDVSFVNETQCYHQLSTKTDPNFDVSYYTYDKLCSGYINSDKTPLCKINRGTGLVSKNRYDNRYYLTGIISMFPATSSENCNNQRWVLFTEVSKYTSNFIVEKYKLYTPVNTPYYQSSCGVKSVQATTLIIHGNNATRSDYPWQVAIYRTNTNNTTKKELICGGTLINQRIILTAAHCVTDDEGNKLSKELFIVAVGKYYRDFNHPDDKDAQFSTLIDISVASQYQGYLQNYVADIAVLITENSFILSKTIEPICIDWNDKYETQFLKPETSGFVSGWGFTQENKDPSQILKELEVPYIRNEQCKKNIPSDYHIYLTYDKMCLGYLNKSKAVCRGDSGGGLVFKNGIDSRYYVIGIVSLSPQSPKGGCDSQRYTLYTKVSVYVKNFIQNYVRLYWR